MFNIYDKAVLATDIPDTQLKKGDIGTIVMVHEGGKGYELEFFAVDGSTVAVETVMLSQIREVQRNEIYHVRDIAA